MKPSEVIESLLTRVAEARERGGTPDPQLLLSCYPGHEDLVQRTLARLETLTTVAHPERVLARMAEVPPTLSPDLTRFGPYEILGELGRGGQGQVYRARDTRLARQVALKVLTGYSAHSESALLRFRREAESASRLDDPGICTVFETGVHQGTPFIAMQLVEGRSLAQRNQRHWSRGADSELATPSGREELEDVLAMISQVARTIHRAHEAGLVHRDLKPGNIMLTDDDRAVVLDFGLAFDSESPDERLTMTGDQLGTPAYMAPEQIEARPGQVDRRADVYALGVTLYETLTGRRPFEGPTRQALYEAILRHDAVPPSRINTSLPRDLDVVILTALERDLDRRYQTALELGDELDRVAQREPIRARPAGPIFRSWRWAQRNPAVAASLAACLVVLTVGLATTTTLWQRSERSRRLADEERNRADASAAAARRHLDEYLRLSDAHMLEGFLREAEHLYPPHPELVGEMERWLLDAMNLADRLPAHQEELRRLRARAQRVPIEDAPSYSLGQAGRALLTVRSRLDEIESAVASGALDEERGRDLQRFAEAVAGSLPDLESARSAHYVYEFPELRDRWRASVLEWMISQLEVFVDPDPRRGAIASMKERLLTAQSIEAASIERHREAWDLAVSDIADRRLHPEYAGLVIKPQVGLVPLGPDPRSGLWEFAHLLTGDPPPRGDDDRLRFDERSALVFVLLPGGSFAMGARRPEADEDPGAANIDPMAIDHEGPVHKVTLDPFFISKYEMSTAQWERGAHELLRDPDAAPVDHAEAGLLPVGRLNWETADRYLRRLGLDLPTEAQWEYAARGGTTTPWWTGSDRESLTGAVNILDLAATQSGNHDPAASEWPNFLDGFPGMAPVHSLLPNPFGLHHVAGNVWEHCRDAFQGYDVPALPGDGLRSLLPTDAYVVRGGSALQPASRCRSAMRASMDSTSSKSTSGVRPIRKLEN